MTLLTRGLFPIRLHQEAGDDVGDVEDAGEEEDLFDALVVAFDDDEPDGEGGERNGDVAADVEEFERAGDSGKLGHDVGHVGEDEHAHQEERDAQAELFAD